MVTERKEQIVSFVPNSKRAYYWFVCGAKPEYTLEVPKVHSAFGTGLGRTLLDQHWIENNECTTTMLVL